MSGRPVADPPTFAIMAGGGTAGHVLPGVAVARALVDSGHDVSSIVFVGSERGLERTLVPDAGFEAILLPGRGIQRTLSFAALGANIAAVWGLLRAMVKGIGLVRRRRPAIVVVLGGYASVACVVGAVLWRVPIVVMEQNARAGLASRIAGRFAKACAVPFDETDLPRAVVTGNPVRPEVLAVDRAADRDDARDRLGIDRDRVLIAVVTGSLGARKVNDAVLAAVPSWAARDDLAIHHVIGSRDWESVQQALPAPDRLQYRAVRYEERMDDVLAAADLLIGRAGGSTVAELAEVGLGGVLVPLPQAPRDHQTANARALERVGGAITIADGTLSGDRLVEVVTPLLDAPDRMAKMGGAAHTLAHPDAAARVAALVEEHARARD